jgi:hypothetical protein
MGFITIFVLAAFVGYEVIQGPEHPPHPADVGEQRHPRDRPGGAPCSSWARPTAPVQITLAFLAVLLATLNIVGGFVVTDRMLEMFKQRQAGRHRDRRPEGRAECVQRRSPAGPGRRGDPHDRATDRSGLPARHRVHPRPQGLSSPKHARNGNLLAAAAACAWPSASPSPTPRSTGTRRTWSSPWWPWSSARPSAVPAARKVKMTAMPQMVAIFNGVGGGAAALVSITEFLSRPGPSRPSTGSPRSSSACWSGASPSPAAPSPSPSCRS